MAPPPAPRPLLEAKCSGRGICSFSGQPATHPARRQGPWGALLPNCSKERVPSAVAPFPGRYVLQL
eukprot:7001211-Pyramimonas_sp.AAC.1